VTATATSDHNTGTGDVEIPSYYDDFIAQAENVREHLLAVGEPEARQEIRPSVEKVIDITRVFHEAANRHRDEVVT
jgi:hypothetical protein